jgi:hypothetical protein
MSATNDSRRCVLLIDDDEVVVGSVRHFLASQDCFDPWVNSVSFVGHGASRPPSFTSGSDSQPSFKGQHQ